MTLVYPGSPRLFSNRSSKVRRWAVASSRRGSVQGQEPCNLQRLPLVLTAKEAERAHGGAEEQRGTAGTNEILCQTAWRRPVGSGGFLIGSGSLLAVFGIKQKTTRTQTEIKNN